MRLIDADSLKEWAEEYHASNWGIPQDELIYAIGSAPTIEPKRGRWEKHILKNANVPWGYDCSACGVWFVVGDDTVEKYYYCPNCGAKMQRSEE